MAREISIGIVGDASGFQRATQDATKHAQGFGNVVKGVGVGLGVGAFNLASDAVGMFVGALGEADQKYKEDQTSRANLVQSLKNNIPAWNGNTDAIEEYASAQGRLGFEDDAVRASVSQLVGVTHNLAEAQQLNSLAQDLARAKNIDLAQATDILTKAHEGNGKALKGLGIDIAGAKTGADLLAAAQKNVNGQAEEFAKTSAGKSAAANVRVQESWERIGRVVDKVAQTVLPMVAGAFEVVGSIIEKTLPIVEALIHVFATVAPVIGNAFGSIGGIVKGAINGVISAVNWVIGAINGIQIHIHAGPVNIDWNGLNLPRIPRLHAGGIVPGMPGQDVPAILQAGEQVIPAGGNGRSITINLYGDSYGDGIDQLADKLALRLRLAGA